MVNHTYENQKAIQCYELIDDGASINSLAQGASGFFGFLTATAMDIAAIGLYVRLWNSIREIYGLPEVDFDDGVSVIKNIVGELISDLVLDKFMGNIPIAGIYFNAICAKQLTWRLGMLFTMLSENGSHVDDIDCKNMVRVIRQLFPQSDMFTFKTPEKQKFLQLVNGTTGLSAKELNEKIDAALAIFDARHD